MVKILKHLALAGAVLLIAACNGQDKCVMSGNPVFEGDYADPEGAVFEGQYWIYPTRSLPFKEQVYMDAFSSPDLVNWTKHEHVLTCEDVSWAWQALWAPSVIEKDGKYYFFFGANDVHEDEIGGIGVAVGDSPAGPFKDALGEPLINDIYNDAQPIDQFVFHDDDGKWYMYYGGWLHCIVVRLNDDLVSLGKHDDGTTYKEITPEGYVEGPFMLKRNGKYYFMWSEGCWEDDDYCVAYSIADSPYGPFKRMGTILQGDPEVGTGAGHHSVIRGRGKDEWYIIYHRHPLDAQTGNNRVVCIDRLYFEKDGSIRPVKITTEGVNKTLAPKRRAQAVRKTKASVEGSNPHLVTRDALVSDAYALAVKTIGGNIDERGLITAGGEYGGEWTRDIAINTWNCCNLLFPKESVFSLWSVTENGETVGHQYWDKIIWVPAAWEQYLVTGDDEMLKKAYACAAATMAQLENSAFDASYGMFKGPSVFNDGIAGYEEPIYDGNDEDSYVLDHPAAEEIKCLSTNCIYYIAYGALAKMAQTLGDEASVRGYLDKADALKAAVRRYLYDADAARLYYLVDQNGDIHHFQEALGYAFAIIGGVVTPEEAAALVKNVHISSHGIPSVWPDFKRFSAEKPGRHNNLVWPFVNAFFSEASLIAGDKDEFMFELLNLANLAMNSSDGHFLEIYNPETGAGDGGWQVGRQHHSCIDQTWSASGFVRMIHNGVLGLSFSKDGMLVRPDPELVEKAGIIGLKGLRYRNAIINISVEKSMFRKGLYMNGKKMDSALVPADAEGILNIVYYR